MSDDGPERGAPRPLGRFGRPVRQGMSLLVVVVAGAAVIGFALRDEINPPAPRPPDTEGGTDTIAPTMAITVSPPAAQQASMPAPQPSVPFNQGPVMPSGGGVLGPPPEKPKRVVSFAPRQQTGQPPQQQSAGGGRATAAGRGTSSPAATGGGGQPDVTAVAFPAATMPGLRAGPAIDTTFVMVPGLYAMTLATPINSERDGTFLATLPRPIKSPAGVTLMEEGSSVWGAYRSQVGPGQSRIVSAAAWGMTPNGVPVPLGEAAAGDGTGRNGMPGEVNTHFWSRFGNALTLMVTQGAFQAATAALQASLSRGGGNTFFNLNTGGLDQAVAAAVRSGIAIQNTVDVAAGTEITFLLSQPIDFSAAYRLAPTGAR